MLFKNSVPTWQEAKCVSITKTNHMKFFGEITDIYFENHTRYINIVWWQMHIYIYIYILIFNSIVRYKSKGVPRQAEVAQGVPGSLRPRIFLTFRHYEGGRSSAKRTGRLYPRRNSWYSFSEAESTSGHMVLSGVPRKKSPVTPLIIDPGTVRLAAQRLNHYATPGPVDIGTIVF